MIEVSEDDLFRLLGKEYFQRMMLDRELTRLLAERDQPQAPPPEQEA